MQKILVVIGTRPEAIKMAPVIQALKADAVSFDVKLCVTGQHREMLDQILRLWHLRPDHDLNIMRPGQTLADVTTRALSGTSGVVACEAPDWVLVQGDTTTAMAGALAAFYNGVSIGHVEAGLRTYDLKHPFPEEANRRVVGLLADLHFAPTQWGADNLIREGVDPRKVHITGNTVIDALHQATDMPFEFEDSPLRDLPIGKKRIIVVTTHRRENFGEPLQNICSAIRWILDNHSDVHVAMPVHPNPHVSGPVYAALGDHEQISLLPPLDYLPLIWLLQHCHFLITDSGGLQEEATGVGKPVLILRETTERPEGVLAGTARLVGANRGRISLWADRLLMDSETYQRMAHATSPYGDGNAATSIASLLRSWVPTESVNPLSSLSVEAHRGSPTGREILGSVESST